MAIACGFTGIHCTIENEFFEFGPLSKKGFIHLLDLKALDLKYRSGGDRALPPPKVTVAAIDEKGIERYGLWPWSRTIIGEFIRRATEQGAKVIGFDAVFADEDKNSSYVTIKRFVEDYEKAELRPEAKRNAELIAAFKDAERTNKASQEALQELEKKLKAQKAPAARQPLSEARKAADDSAKTLARARERLTDWARSSGEFYATMSKEVASLSPDEALANGVSMSPQTVMGFVTFQHESEVSGIPAGGRDAMMKALEPVAIRNVYKFSTQEVGGQTIEMLEPVQDEAMNKLQVRPIVAALAPLPSIAAKSKGFGYFNAYPDPDGPIRRLWMVERKDDALYPSLSLSVAAKYFGGEPRPIKGQLWPHTLDSITLSGTDVTIPTDMHGRLLINYYKAPEEYFPTYSVADFIDGTVPPEMVKDKVILFGMTALGWFDLRPNPFSGATPGVYIHAQVVQNVLDGLHLERYFGFAMVEMMAYMLLGILLGLFMPRVPVWGGLLATIAFAFGLYWIDVLFVFSRGTWMLNVLPTLQVALTFVGVTVHGYLTEGKEKRKIRKAFQFYLTKSVVDEMLKDPTKLKLGGERKICTVLFSDIRGFTTISERLSPEELVHLLNSYLTPMTNLVFKYDGTLDKYMGDAIMAIFGAPIAYPNHATRACFAALDMMAELRVLQDQWRAQNLPNIDIGIGLNTGPMAVGNMGSDSRFDYTVMGDNVNLGSRLEGINKQYGTNIIISEFTLEAAKADVYVREMDSVRVKGKKEPVRIFELMGKGQPDAAAQAVIDAFHQALALFKSQKWDDAVVLFEKIRTELKPNDFASGMYIERCAYMKDHPPGQDWDGVTTMKTK